MNDEPTTQILWRAHLPIADNFETLPAKDVSAFFEAALPHASERLETTVSEAANWLIKRHKNFEKEQVKPEKVQTVGGKINGNDRSLKARTGVIGYILGPDGGPD